MHSAYQRAEFPYVAGHPIQSFPLVGLLDCTPLLGLLKDQEENLIVVKRGHRGERKDIPNNQQLLLKQQTQYVVEQNTYARNFKK